MCVLLLVFRSSRSSSLALDKGEVVIDAAVFLQDPRKPQFAGLVLHFVPTQTIFVGCIFFRPSERPFKKSSASSPEV
jgi:hypothetical protein